MRGSKTMFESDFAKAEYIKKVVLHIWKKEAQIYFCELIRLLIKELRMKNSFVFL